MKEKATYAYWIDRKRAKKNGKYPIKLRITYQRKRKYYSTGTDLSSDEWDKMHSEKPGKRLQETLKELLDLVGEAQKVGDNLPSFSFHQFEEAFFNAPDDALDVYEAYDRQIKFLNENNRIGNRNNFKDSKSSLMKFKAKLSFYDITPDFLNEYEKWMLANNRSMTTIGFYLRPLRTLMNQAIENKVISRDAYPFKKRKYKVPTGKRGNVFLTLDETRIIRSYVPILNSTEERSKDFWLFSFFCNGMNFKDIFNLKYYQIQNHSFSFIREKTRNTTKEDPIIVEVQLNKEIKRIIDKWGNKNKNPDNYVFPFVNNSGSVDDQSKKLKQFTKTTNKYMKRICKKVGIEKEVTTYVARHSFAYIIITSGGSIEELRELLGHKSITTTQNYISQIIPSERKKKLADALM
nr:site-specific integrase [uncultured Carboxylicivirga sp.]